MYDSERLSPVRRVRSLLFRFWRWGTRVGWNTTWHWLTYKTRLALGFPPESMVEVTARRAVHRLLVRRGRSSDFDVLSQIFQQEEYSSLRGLADISVIMDLGANVGYSTAYLLSCFPNATALALEPDPCNFVLCRRNLAPYGKRARVVAGAVWSTRTVLALRKGFGDGREWATQVSEVAEQGGERDVQAWDVPSLLEAMGAARIDLLKVDIEGSEVELFGPNSAEWLPRVRHIVIELHGRKCEETFFAALRGFDYELSTDGELTICQNLRPKDERAPFNARL